MVGGGSPQAVQQFHAPELVERDAAPVIRRSHRLQTALAFSAVLVTKHAELPIFVPSQAVRTKQPVAIVINGRDRPSGLHRRAHSPINILLPTHAARFGNTHHSFRLLGLPLTHGRSIFYNTVILAFGAIGRIDNGVPILTGVAALAFAEVLIQESYCRAITTSLCVETPSTIAFHRHIARPRPCRAARS